MKFQFLIGFLLTQSTAAFVPAATQSKSGVSTSLNAVPVPSEVTAQQLTNYMAKSHEEKLKALKTLEEQKNKEIQVSEFVMMSIDDYVSHWICVLQLCKV